jgi:toxin ParE1/3/4
VVTFRRSFQIFGGLNCREALGGQNRVVYEVRDDTICIHVVTDTRRELRTLLQKRLLRAR